MFEYYKYVMDIIIRRAIYAATAMCFQDILKSPLKLPWNLRFLSKKTTVMGKFTERTVILMVLKFVQFFVPTYGLMDNLSMAEWSALWNNEDSRVYRGEVFNNRHFYVSPEQVLGGTNNCYGQHQFEREYIAFEWHEDANNAKAGDFYSINRQYEDKITGETPFTRLDARYENHTLRGWIVKRFREKIGLRKYSVRRPGRPSLLSGTSEFDEFLKKQWEARWGMSYDEYKSYSWLGLAARSIKNRAIAARNDIEGTTWEVLAAEFHRTQTARYLEAKVLKDQILTKCLEENSSDFCRGVEPALHQVIAELEFEAVYGRALAAENKHKMWELQMGNFSINESNLQLSATTLDATSLHSVYTHNITNSISSFISFLKKDILGENYSHFSSIRYLGNPEDAQTLLWWLSEICSAGTFGIFSTIIQWFTFFDSWFICADSALFGSKSVYGAAGAALADLKLRWVWSSHVEDLTTSWDHLYYIIDTMFYEVRESWLRDLALANTFYGGNWETQISFNTSPYLHVGQHVVELNRIRLDLITSIWCIFKPFFFATACLATNVGMLAGLAVLFAVFFCVEIITRGLQLNPWISAGRMVSWSIFLFVTIAWTTTLLAVFNPLVLRADFHLFFIDGLSTLFIILTLVITHICMLVGWPVRQSPLRFSWFLSILGLLLVIAFSISDIFVFYIVFEAILIPTYILIGRWGSQAERSYAAFMFFLYTLVGSIFFLVALVTIHKHCGTFHYVELISLLQTLPVSVQQLIWWCLVVGFAFKVPLFFVHTWLTVAHVEAPTVGSIILASLLLKLGGYGLIRFVLLLLPGVTVTEGPILCSVALLGYSLATISAIRQLDLKRFVAYTSIAHMNFSVLGLLTATKVGYLGAIHSMFSHGLIAAGLFLLVGVVYDRFHVRNVLYFSGLASIMPEWSILFFILMLANSGFPFFSGFPGELYTLLSVFTLNPIFALIAFAGFILTIVYTFLTLTRVLFGTPYFNLKPVLDTIETERTSLLFLIVGSLAIGVVPGLVFSFFY